jgi:hypothetical protein
LKSGIHHSVSRGGGELLQQKAQKGRPRALIFKRRKNSSFFVAATELAICAYGPSPLSLGALIGQAFFRKAS